MERLELNLQATPEDVMRAVEALQEFCREKGVPENQCFGLALALEESASNVVNHALGRDARKKFQVTIERTAAEIRITLRDSGSEFDPTKRAVPVKTGTEERHGGWGIELVRRYSDEIRYAREGDENVLLLIKRWGAPPSQK